MLNGPKRGIALAAFEPTDIRAVVPELLSEVFLGEPARQAMPAKVLAEDALQVPFHGLQRWRAAT